MLSTTQYTLSILRIALLVHDYFQKIFKSRYIERLDTNKRKNVEALVCVGISDKRERKQLAFFSLSVVFNCVMMTWIEFPIRTKC